jgi:hypothetical protein
LWAEFFSCTLGLELLGECPATGEDQVGLRFL